MNPDLQQFVREALLRGTTRAEIRQRLVAAGWRDEEVEAALGAWAEAEFAIPVPRRRPYLSAREAFLYLVLFVTLYITAFNVGMILFQLVERGIPDPAAQTRFATLLASGPLIRNAVAALVIAYPVFLFVSALIGRSIAREPENRSSRVRKWLTYLTLFVAALILIGDLTVVVSRGLGGELAPRFVLKALVVFAIAGVVFGHYLGDLRREEDRATSGPARGSSWLARVAGITVVGVLVAGLLAVGSPVRERQLRLDRQRIEDLRQISTSVENHFRARRSLPVGLEALLERPEAGLRSLDDPVSGELYGYRILDSTGYELCATFEVADSLGAESDASRPSRFWGHGPGRSCFEFQIPAHILRAR